MLYVKLLQNKFNHKRGEMIFLPDYFISDEGKEYTLSKHVLLPKGTHWAYKTKKEAFDTETAKIDKLRNKLNEKLVSYQAKIIVLEGIN